MFCCSHLFTCSCTSCICFENDSSSIVDLLLALGKLSKYDTLIRDLPFTISKFSLPINMLTKFLYEKSSCIDTTSHFLNFFPTNHLNRFPRLMFTASIFHFFWKWSVEMNCNIILVYFQKALYKWKMNLIYLAKVMLLGKPWKHISLNNKTTMFIASIVFLRGIKWASLEDISTNTKIKSSPLYVLGNPNTNSC